MPPFVHRHRAVLVLALLVVGVIAAHAAWIRVDDSPLPSPDAYRYLTSSLRLTDTISGLGRHDPPSLAALSPGGRPPVYVLMSVPFLSTLGRSADAGLALNAFFLALMMAATFALARRRGGAGAGLLAAVLVAAMPPILHLLRTFRPHAALPACAALSLWLLVELLDRRTPGWAWAFWGSFLFGAAMHPTYVFILAIPAAFGAVTLLVTEMAPSRASGPREGHNSPVSWWRRLTGSRLLWRGMVPAVLCAAMPLAAWYLTQGLSLWKTLVHAASEEAAAVRGAEVAVTASLDQAPNVAWYVTTAPAALGNVLCGFAVIALVMSFTKRRRASDWVLPVTLAGSVVVLGSMPTYAWLYATPALPAVAALVAIWTFELKHRALRTLIVTLLVAVAIVQFAWCSWGRGGQTRMRPLLVALGAQPDVHSVCRFDRLFCAAPPISVSLTTGLVPMIETILREPRCGKGRTCQVLVVGRSYPNPQLLSFLTIQRWPRARLDFVTQGTNRYGGRYGLNSLLRSDFIISHFRRRRARGYERDTLALLRRPPALFAASHQRMGHFKTPRGQLRLIKRVKALTRAERNAVAHALGLGQDGLPLPNRPQTLDVSRPKAGRPGAARPGAAGL